MIDLLYSLILGLIQGLTEFLPISSSGHLALASHILNYTDNQDLSFEIFVHLGSLIAVFIYFRNDIIELLKSIVYYNNAEYNNNRKICLFLLIASIVTGIIGFLTKNLIVNLFNYPIFVACMIAVTGGILFISDKLSQGFLKHYEIGSKKAALIGLGQAFALIPGISRSGTTITCSLLTGMDRKSAATFSFLLSIPAILGANLSEFSTLLNLNSTLILNYLIGFIAAFVSGYVVIAWLIKLVINAKLKYFSYYCWFIAALFLVLL